MTHRPGRVLLVAAACVLAAAAGVAWRMPVTPRVAQDLERDAEIERLLQESAALERQSRALARSIAAKDEALAELLAGRLTLFEAAARFRDSDRDRPPELSPKLHLTYPGHSEGERRCRQVIKHVAFHLQHEPSRRDLLVARLQAELDGHLREHGTVRLPAEQPPL